MSMQGRKNKQARKKQAIETLRYYGAKALADNLENEHEEHKALNKKKNWPTNIIKR
jgi:hypothetical protein